MNILSRYSNNAKKQLKVKDAQYFQALLFQDTPPWVTLGHNFANPNYPISIFFPAEKVWAQGSET